MRAIPLLLTLSLVLAAPAGAASVRVVTDPRIELMTVVQLLADYPVLSSFDSPYRRDVQVYFSRHKDHPVVPLFHEMFAQGFGFDAVPHLLLALTPPPELKPRFALSKELEGRAGGKEKIDQFVTALRDFAHRSRFMIFYEAHQGTYEQVVESTRPVAEHAVAALSRYAGKDLNGSTIVLGMLLHAGGFAVFYDLPDGSVEATAILGPRSIQEAFLSFGSENQIKGMTMHEFSHTFVNPLTEKHWGALARHEALYAPIAEKMRRQAYPVWEIAVNEHIVRAITIRMAYLDGGQEVGDKELRQQKDRGFQYVEALVERLKEYEGARDRYPTIAEFYPRLLRVFQEAAGTGK